MRRAFLKDVANDRLSFKFRRVMYEGGSSRSYLSTVLSNYVTGAGLA